MPEQIPLRRKISDANGCGSVALVVEDSHVLRKFICRILTLRGYAVLEAVDGQEAIDIFRVQHDRIQFVVMDIEMPRMNGIDAFHIMRAIRSDIPVIMVSGHSPEEYTHRLPVSDLCGVLRKPFMPDELFATIGRCRPGNVSENAVSI